jgi:Domain of unknown function (DUF6946)
MSQKKILIPTENAESWKPFLAEPEKQWKDGYSAKSVAVSWEKNRDIPIEIKEAMNKSEILKDAELLLAIPEYKVSLPGGNRDSQNDVLAIMRHDYGLIVAAVEAKFRESFGNDTVNEWLKNASDGKKERLSFILNIISFPQIDYCNLRYQLFHRLASAVIMAKKFYASQAIMIIQSFEEDDKKNHYGDFTAFVEAYGKTVVKKEPIELAQVDGLTISTMWVNS